MSNIIPYGLSTDVLPLEEAPDSDCINGVIILCDEENVEMLATTLSRWFVKRPYVTVVDYGHFDKRDGGYIVMEWAFHEIDQLFLDILESEDPFENYATYEKDGVEE